jgi:hypothetical protein
MQCVAVFLAVVLLHTSGEAQCVRVENPGFEDAGDNGLPGHWSGPVDVYQRDTATAFSGRGASLRYVNTNPDKYVLCVQPVQLEPGRMYDVRARVKTQGIQGEESGATICLEWCNAQGKWVGGCYPAGVKGDHDWTEVRGVSARVPPNTSRYSVACYVRKGMTGTAWWDDVQVTRLVEAPLATVLRVPNYRAQVTDSGPRRAIIGARINLRDYEPLTLRDVMLRWKMVSDDYRSVPFHREVKRGERKHIDGQDTTVAVPAAGLPPKWSVVEIDLVNKKTGEILSSEFHLLNRLKGRPAPAVYIDGHNRLIFHGEPFFPLGMYWGTVTKEDLDIYADSAFNCLMPYGSPDREQMDLCHACGLKVIYSVKDIYYGSEYCPKDIPDEAAEVPYVTAKVDAFRNHPALLAWYINDELGLDLLERLTKRRDDMEWLDRDHPTWVVLYQVDQIAQFLPTFDIIGTDPYPIPGRPASLAADWTRKTVGGVQKSRPVWMVPQVFNWACYRKTDAEKQQCRPPTLEEMRSMAWQCIAEGANGLIFYSWMDLHRDKATPFDESWPRVKTVAREIADLIPVLLSVEKTPHIQAPEDGWLNWAARKQGHTTYLIAVNNSPQPRSAEFRLPRKPKSICLHNAEKTASNVTGASFPVDFDPLAVRIFEIAGL